MIKFYADPRKMAFGYVSIKLKVSYGKRIEIPTKLKFKKEEWNIIENHSILQSKTLNLDRNKLQQIRMELSEYLRRAEELIDQYEKNQTPFDLNRFKNDYYTFTPATLLQSSFSSLVDSFIQEKKKNHFAKSTIESYSSATMAIRNYVINSSKIKNKSNKRNPSCEKIYENFSIASIDFAFLKGFEKFMLNPPEDSGQRAISESTVQSYLICIRAIFNYAISKGIVTQKMYPFSSKNNGNYYKIRPSNRVKKSLNKDDITKLVQIKNKLTVAQVRAIEFFFISFHCNGANLKDIALLKVKNYNIKARTLTFSREKSRSRKEFTDETMISVNEPLARLIEKYRSSNGELLFDLIEPEFLSDQNKISVRIKTITRSMNRLLIIVAEKAGIDRFSLSWARHTFATLAYLTDSNLDYLSNALSHSSIATTKRYIDTLPVIKSEPVEKLKTELFKNDNA